MHKPPEEERGAVAQDHGGCKEHDVGDEDEVKEVSSER